MSDVGNNPIRRRPMLLALAACLVGALFQYTAVRFDFLGFAIAVLAITAIVLCIVFRKRAGVWVLVALAILTFTVSGLLFGLNKPLAINKTNASIAATVADVKQKESGFTKVRLKNVVVEGVLLKGYTILEVSQETDLSAGDRVTFTGDIAAVEMFKDSYQLGLFANDVRYSSKAETFLTHQKGKADIFQIIKQNIFYAMYFVMPEDDVGVAMSLLFGDTSSLSSEDNAAVKASGTTHIFSVSGLHVGFLVGAAVWVLKKAKANKAIIFSSVAVLLVLYGFLTGFPASFLRAAWMSSALLLAPLINRRYDALSALAFSAVCIIVVSPLSLFTAGFQMSFAALLGITLIYRVLERWLRRFLKFKILSSSVSLSVSSTLGILPVTLAYFQVFQPYFILSNLLVVPLTAIAYLAVLFPSFIAAVLPTAGFLFYPGKYLLRALVALTYLFAAFPFATVTIPSLGVASVPYYSGLFTASPFAILPTRKKLTLSVIFFSAAALLYAVVCILAVTAANGN